MRKGFNQIDLVFAVVITMFVVFLSVLYSSHFLQPVLNTGMSLEIKHLAKGLSDTVFNDQGIPEEWQWSGNSVKPSLGSCIYRVDLHLEEWNGTDNSGVTGFAYIETGENAYNGSIVVYDGNQTLEAELKDVTDSDGDGFLDEVNVTFNVSVPSYGEKIIHIFYSRDNETNFGYGSLPETNNTLNVTQISPQRYTGLTTSKMNALADMELKEAREKFGVDCPFRLAVEKTGGAWHYGYELTDRNTGVNRKKVLLQNSTGHVESVSAVTYVWK